MENITIEKLGAEKYWERLAEIKQHTKTSNVEKWKKDIIKWVNSDPDLKNNVINLVTHDDEKTLHAHLIVTPVVDGKLTAKQFWTPAKSAKWQASYAKATGLEKGVSSDVKHQDKKTYELKEAAKKGYIKGKKVGYKKGKEEGYSVGYKAGVQASEGLGVKVGSAITSMMGQLHKPNASLTAQLTEEKRLKDEEVKKSKELARQAKIEADNRVTKIANELREVKLQNQNLIKENDEKDRKLAELLPDYQSQNRLSVKKKN